MEPEFVTKEQMKNEGYTLNEISKLIAKNLQSLAEEELLIDQKVRELQDIQKNMMAAINGKRD